MIGTCLASLPLKSTRLFRLYGFGLSSSTISGFEGVAPPEIGRNSSPQPPTSFLTPPANNPALRSDSLSQLISLTRSHSVSLLISPLSQLHSNNYSFTLFINFKFIVWHSLLISAFTRSPFTQPAVTTPHRLQPSCGTLHASVH
jgi:hypothetical protein